MFGLSQSGDGVLVSVSLGSKLGPADSMSVSGGEGGKFWHSEGRALLSKLNDSGLEASIVYIVVSGKDTMHCSMQYSMQNWAFNVTSNPSDKMIYHIG